MISYLSLLIFCCLSLIRGRSSAEMPVRAIAKAPEGEGCPRCGGCVYAAEQMLARGRVSYRTALLPVHRN